MTKVSVIVPVYNAERYLSKCLDSLVRQTLQDIEVIIVDDCSTDGSANIAESYQAQSPRTVRLVRASQNRGPGGARNLGLAVASGEYVAFVDSDDWVTEDAFAKLLDGALSGEADIAVCDYAEYRGHDRPLKLRTEWRPTLLGEGTVDRRGERVALGPSAMYAALIRRRLIVDNDIAFPEDVRAGEDLISRFVWALSDRIVRVPEPLLTVRKNNPSLTRSSDAMHLHDFRKMLPVLSGLFAKHEMARNYTEEFQCLMAHAGYILPVRNAALKFSRPDVSALRDLRSQVRMENPKYAANRFVRKLPWKLRLLARINDASPEFLSFAGRTYRRLSTAAEAMRRRASSGDSNCHRLHSSAEDSEFT